MVPMQSNDQLLQLLAALHVDSTRRKRFATTRHLAASELDAVSAPSDSRHADSLDPARCHLDARDLRAPMEGANQLLWP